VHEAKPRLILRICNSSRASECRILRNNLCRDGASQTLHRVWGVVYFPNGDRIANATVSVLELERDDEVAVEKTDDQGKFSFDQLKPGSYRLHIRVNGLPGTAGTMIVLAHPNAKWKKEVAVNISVTLINCSNFLLVNAKQFEAVLNPTDSWFQDDCTGATLQIAKARATADQKIVLRLQTGNMNGWHFAFGAGWVPVKGKLCTTNDKCQDASEAELWVNKPNEENPTWISGKYKLAVAGRHLVGDFFLEYKAHEENPYICE